MLRIGYARVSTEDQSLDLQINALRQAGCERVFTDKASAVKTHRPGLSEARSHLRAGDVLVVWKLDRLGRSVKGLVDLVGELAQPTIIAIPYFRLWVACQPLLGCSRP
jgi:DNA invertase Pin-like site-specific DNA recombinase